MYRIGRGVALGFAGLVAVSALSGCAGQPTDSPELTLRVATAGVAAVEPGSTGDRFLDSALFDSLGQWRPQENAFESWLATSFEFSDDRKVLTLELRDDVTFVDGEELTAAGVETYFEYLIASGEYVFAGQVAKYELDFVATAEHVLELRASVPLYEGDLWWLFYTPVLSPAAAEDPENGQNIQLYGSGPYVVAESTPEVEYTLVRNPDYWNPEAFPFDTIVGSFIVDPVARLNALKSGQVDAAPLTIELASEAESSGFRINEVLGFGRVLWIYDPANTSVPALQDVRVRQAMAMAFDREAIEEQIDRGYGRVSSQVLLPGQPGYVEGGDEQYPYDPEAARELMAEAGYADGFDLVIPSSPDGAVVEPVVAQSLADIGIRVTYQQYADRGEWFKAFGSGIHAVVLEPFHSPTYTVPLLTADYGEFGKPFAPNADIFELVDRIQNSGPEESLEASQELGQKLLDEVWYIPISWPASVIATREDIVVTMSPTDVTMPDFPVIRDYQLAE